MTPAFSENTSDKKRGSQKVRCGRASVISRLRLEPLERREMFAVLTWSPGINLPSPRAGAAAIETAAQAILVVGGGTTTINQLSAGGAAWGTASAIDMARVSPGVGSTGAQFLVYGGTSGGGPLEEALIYDPYNLDNVQDAAVMHAPRTQFGFATDTGHPYAIGGLGNGNSVLAAVERYDAASDSWSIVAPLPQARFAFPAVDDGMGHIFTFGGATTNNSASVSNTVYRYSVDTNTWTTVAPMLTATRDSAAVLASNGRIYVLGGSSGSASLATVQSYDLLTNSWATETNLPSPVSSAAAVSDSLGRIEVIGGYDQNHIPLSTVVVSQKLNVPDVGPVFTSTASTSALTGSTYTYQATASGNPQPTFSLVTAPTGMTIDAGTGLISWAPTVAQAGPNSVTVRATNVVGSVDQSFSVSVLTPAPTIPTGLVVTGTTTNSVSLAWAPAIDSIGVAGYRVYRVTHTGWHGTVTSYTQYADVPGTSATISVPNQGYTYTFAVAAYNASGNKSGYSSKVSATTLSPPSYFGPTSVSVTANHPLSFSLSAGGNPATFTFSAINVPAGMTVNPSTGVVNWTPSDSAVGTGSYSFSISNGVGTTTAVVTVQVLTNLPNVTYIQNGAAVATQPFGVQFSQASDPYNASPVTYSLVTAPSGMVIDSSSGELSWIPSVSDVGTASVTVRATNYAGARDTGLSIPVYFSSAVQGVTASNVSTTSATLSWSSPAVFANEIQGYHIRASYVTHSGRFNTTHVLNFTAAASATSLVLTGLPTSKTISVSVTAYDAANHDGLAGTTSFSTAYATPTITVSGGPFTYDGLPHAVSAIAYGIGGMTPVSGAFTYLYNGSDVPPTEPGTYAVEAVFTSANTYYADTVGTGSLTIVPATPLVLIDGEPFVYDGTAHSATATAYAIDGLTPISGSFSFSYEGSPVAPSNPGVYGVVATFTSSDPRYANASASGTLTTTSIGSILPLLELNTANVTYDGADHPASAIAYRTDGVTPSDGTYSFTYDGLTAPPTNAGTYAVEVRFASRDPDYADAELTGSLTIAPAIPSLELFGDLTYTGYAQEAAAVAYGVNGTNPVAGSFTFTYDDSPTAPTEAGTYSVAATFVSSDPNYAGATTNGSMTIAPALPWVIAVGGWFTYDGTAHEATATVVGGDGATPVSGSLSLDYFVWDNILGDYQPLATTPVNAGSYYALATFTSADPNYSDSLSVDSLYIDLAMPMLGVSGGPFVFDGAPHHVDTVAYGVDGVTPVSGIWSVTYDGSTTPPSDPGTYQVVAGFTPTDPSNSYYDASVTTSMTIGASLVARQLFYNQSYFDGYTSGVSASDGNAIAVDKTALLPGQIATFDNVSSFTKGINGVMIDIEGAHGSISAADFIFKVGNNNSPGTWASAPAPSTVSVLSGAGVNGSDRIEILWANNTIHGTWLEVITLSNPNTGLPSTDLLPEGQADVFFFGSVRADSGLGDTTTQANVNATDELAARNNPASLAFHIPITNLFDYNRDGQVNTTDALASRNYPTNTGNVVRFLSISSPPAAPQAAPVGDGAEQTIATALAAPAMVSPTTGATQVRWTQPIELPPLRASGLAKVFEQFAEAGTMAPARHRTLADVAEWHSLDEDLLDALTAFERAG